MDRREKAISLGLRTRSMLDAPQLGYLYDLALAAPAGIGVECGVAFGGSLLCWAAARFKRGPVIGVDNGLGRWDIANRNLRAHGLEIIYLDAESWVIGEAMALAQAVAFCFIDACHNETGIGRDLQTWPKTIMPGGIIAYHDYGASKCPDIKRCVDNWQHQANWEPLTVVGSTAAYKRPDGGHGETVTRGHGEEDTETRRRGDTVTE